MAEFDTDVTAEVMQEAAEEELRICLFTMSGESYAVTVDILVEIIIPQKIFPVPTTPAHVIGVINLRGNIVPIVDIRPALSLTPQSAVSQIAIIRYNQMILGIVVDAVSEVIAVPLSSILPLPAEVAAQEPGAKNRSRYLQSIVQRPKGVAAMLNIERLLEAIRLS